MVYRNIYYIKQEMDEQSKIYNINTDSFDNTMKYISEYTKSAIYLRIVNK